MDGPKIILDKSVLQKLSIAQLFELELFFEIMPAPILKLEILSNLSKPKTDETDWVSVMKSLCRKIAGSGVEMVHFRKAAIGEMMDGQSVPMDGRYFIDLSASHVSVRGPAGRRGIHVDGRLVQSEWRRWADGEFTEEERTLSESFRNEIFAFDMSEMQRFKEKHGKQFMHCKTQDALIQEVRALFDNPARDNQNFLCGLALANVVVPDDYVPEIISRFRQSGAKTLREFAPFTASITQVFFTWLAMQIRGFHGQRRSDICDIEYLYYAPFCKVFASCDKLHKVLWGATTSTAVWCDGFELLDDLTKRAELRKSDPECVKGPYPIPLEGSIITRVYEELRHRR
jgi:hypothetical protein